MTAIKTYADIEQSRKLAEILPLESADSHYVRKSTDFMGKPVNGKWSEPKYGNPEKAGYVVQNFSSYEKLPCWSLAALLNVIPGGQVNRMANSDKWEASSWNDSDFEPAYYVEDYDNPVDACVAMIDKLKQENLL